VVLVGVKVCDFQGHWTIESVAQPVRSKLDITTAITPYAVEEFCLEGSMAVG
jgi:hypothetical protein